MNVDIDFLASAIASLHVEIGAQIAAGKAKDARIAELEALLRKQEGKREKGAEE